MKKRNTLIIAILVAGMLVACGNQQKDSTGSADSNITQDVKNEKTETETSETKTPETEIINPLAAIIDDYKNGNVEISGGKINAQRFQEISSEYSKYITDIGDYLEKHMNDIIDGKKLCDLARAGVTVERKARPVTIYKIFVENIELPYVTMTVSCSKGTYIRTLCHDIGAKLGCGAAMKSLVRLQAAGYRIEDAYKLDALQEFSESGTLKDAVTPIERVFEVYPVLTAKPEFDIMLKNGNKMALQQFQEMIKPELEMKVRVRMSDGRFAAVYEYREDLGLFRPLKMFLED